MYIKKEFKNYGKGVICFGKHKGKTLSEIFDSEDYRYIIWISKNVKGITVSPKMLSLCFNNI